MERPSRVMLKVVQAAFDGERSGRQDLLASARDGVEKDERPALVEEDPPAVREPAGRFFGLVQLAKAPCLERVEEETSRDLLGRAEEPPTVGRPGPHDEYAP